MTKHKKEYYFFVDEDETENVSNTPPQRHPTEHFWICPHPTINNCNFDNLTELPQGTIEALFHTKLTWNDKPILITL